MRAHDQLDAVHRLVRRDGAVDAVRAIEALAAEATIAWIEQPLGRDNLDGLRLLRQGEDFAKVAKEHSLSPDREQGGDLGFFAKGEMPPEFDAIVFKLAPGRISDLVQSDYGFHIFLVAHRKPS